MGCPLYPVGPLVCVCRKATTVAYGIALQGVKKHARVSTALKKGVTSSAWFRYYF